jgi:hypothetical protein
MTTYGQYGVCQFGLLLQGYAACGHPCEVISGSVKVDQKKDKESVEWGDSNPAPYAKPLGTETSGATQRAGVLGLAVLTSLAVLFTSLS